MKLTTDKTKNNQESRIYEPDHIQKLGLKAWKEMVGEIIRFRGLIWRFLVRDISARYRQSLLGIFWAFFPPLVVLVVFVWGKSANIIPIAHTDMPYAVFVFLGQMVWLFFSHGVMLGSNSLVDAGSLLTKIGFPREVIVFSAIGQSIFEFVIRIPLLLLIFLFTGFSPKPQILLMPTILIPFVLLTAGVALWLSLLNALFRDVGPIVGVSVNIGVFLAPVVYPPPETWPVSFLINHLNPVSAFITASRDLALSGSLTNIAQYMSASIFSLLFFVFSWRFFHALENKINEKI